jgi:hypothetical protein
MQVQKSSSGEREKCSYSSNKAFASSKYICEIDKKYPQCSKKVFLIFYKKCLDILFTSS